MELQTAKQHGQSEAHEGCVVCGAWTPPDHFLCDACDRGLTTMQYADLFWDEV
jgi:hypothetical protein